MADCFSAENICDRAFTWATFETAITLAAITSQLGNKRLEELRQRDGIQWKCSQLRTLLRCNKRLTKHSFGTNVRTNHFAVKKFCFGTDAKYIYIYIYIYTNFDRTPWFSQYEDTVAMKVVATFVRTAIKILVNSRVLFTFNSSSRHKWLESLSPSTLQDTKINFIQNIRRFSFFTFFRAFNRHSATWNFNLISTYRACWQNLLTLNLVYTINFLIFTVRKYFHNKKNTCPSCFLRPINSNRGTG